jgi:hypothetical protein
LTIIVFILGWSVANSIFASGVTWGVTWAVTWGEVGVLLMGMASALFVAASEFFLLSKECDVYSIPENLERSLPDFFKAQGKEWSDEKSVINSKCRTYNNRGKRCYNYGVFTIFIGLWFVISPYNVIISTVVVASGIGLELFEWFGRTKSKT